MKTQDTADETGVVKPTQACVRMTVKRDPSHLGCVPPPKKHYAGELSKAGYPKGGRPPSGSLPTTGVCFYMTDHVAKLLKTFSKQHNKTQSDVLEAALIKYTHQYGR